MPKSSAEKDAEKLLKPVFAAFKRQAVAAIREKEAEMASVLRVDYDAPVEARPSGMPTPRLQLRWEQAVEGMWERVCHYEMVFGLGENDCRNDAKTGVAVIQLGRTRQGGREPDWRTDLGMRTPFRDGAHAGWDSAQFGGWPVFVVAPDGSYALMVTAEEQRRRAGLV